jgi:hypothetical protein
MLGSFFSENRAFAGFEFCCLSFSVSFKGLLGGIGTGTRLAFFVAAPQVSATNKAVKTAPLLYIHFAFEADIDVATKRRPLSYSGLSNGIFDDIRGGNRIRGAHHQSSSILDISVRRLNDLFLPCRKWEQLRRTPKR